MVLKLITNKKKVCLSKFVSEEQSAFVEGQSILNNVLLDFETIHALNRKTKGSKRELALKIDINKAYDRMDWVFRNDCFVVWDLKRGGYIR